MGEFVRQKKCRICKQPFDPIRFGQVVCTENNFKCANELAKQQREKKEKKQKQEYRKETKRRKEAIKTKPVLVKEAQKAFNRFIRARDADQPCISCDAPPRASATLTGGRWDCGHYRSVGSAPELRFEELNGSKQCKRCNDFLGGNIVEYRIRLKAKIGADRLAWLEEPHAAKNYTHQDLRRLKITYNRRARELEKKIE